MQLDAASQILHILADAAIVTNDQGRIVMVNPAVTAVLGYEPGELVGQPLDVLIPPRFAEQHRYHVTRFRESSTPKPMSGRRLVQARHKSGNEIPVSIALTNVKSWGGVFTIAIVRHIPAVVEDTREEALRIDQDPLTGFGNRVLLSRCIADAIGAKRPFALLFLDLTQFKHFNDCYGHEVGDQVLRLAAKRMHAIVRPGDAVVRLGGDEFVLVIDPLGHVSELVDIAEAVHESIGRKFSIDGTSANIGVNIGSAAYPRDGESEDDLLRVADRNMYRAKYLQRPYCLDPNPAADTAAG